MRKAFKSIAGRRKNRYDEFSVIFNSVCLPVYVNRAKTESEIKTILTGSPGVELGRLESEKRD